MNGFERRKNEKQTTILQVATTLFTKQGIKETSVKQIAKEASVSPVTIFNYFESKDKLLLDVCLSYFETAYQTFESLVHQENRSFEEKLHELFSLKNQVASDIHPEFYNFLMQEYTNPENQLLTQLANQTNSLQHELFSQGQTEGMINPNISLSALMFYLELLGKSMENKEIYQAALPFTEDILELFLYGIYGKRE